MSPSFITTRQVADLIGLSANTFLRHRERLERDEGFPEPMPTSRHPLRWRRDQVEAWVSQVGRPRAQSMMPSQLPPNIALLEEARRA